MNESEIRVDYLGLRSVADDAERLRRLEVLRKSADDAGLRDWVALIDARLALWRGEHDTAVALSTAMIEQPQLSPDIEGWARLNRGVAYGRKGEPDKAIADYTAVIEDPSSPPEQKAESRFNRGVTYGEKGEPDKAIADCTAVIEDPSSPPEQKARARVSRGVTYGEKGEPDKAIADYTAAIEDPSAPPDQKAKARVNRGVTFGEKGEPDKAIADYTAVIEDPSAPPEPKAKARFNRGVTFGQKGEPDKAIADYTAAIEDPSAPPDQKAKARVNRGVTFGQKGEPDKAIADFTAVIEDPSAPPDEKAQARFNRGVTFGEKGEPDKAIADYTAAIEDPSAPPDQKAKARVNRGVTFGQKGEPDKAIADFTAVIEDPSAPPDQKAKARVNRGVTFGQKGEPDKAIADYTAVIEDPSAPPDQKAKARVNRGVTFGQKGEPDKEIADYTAVIEDPQAPVDVIAVARMMASTAGLQSEKARRAVIDLPVELDLGTREAFKRELESARERKRDFFGESLFDTTASFLLIAREWNSFTPAVPGEGEPSRGGGYFMKHLGTGIVVDPGFDFLEIFANAGGRLCDIDHIVVTHAHNDHTAELEAILTLLFEFNDRSGKDPARQKKVKLHLSQGAARKFAGLLDLKDCTYLDEVVTLNRGRTESPQVVPLWDQVSLTVLPAYHDDVVTCGYAVGLGFEFRFGDGSVRCLAFTGDTAVYPRGQGGPGKVGLPAIHEAYPRPFRAPGADMVVAHIGSIEEFELEGPLGKLGGEDRSFSPETTYDKHLGLRGTFFLLCGLRPKAAIVSEFGDEMKGIWIKAVRAVGRKLDEVLKDETPPGLPVFAGDPVTIYNIQSGQFLCHEDLAFHDAGELKMLGVHEVGAHGQGPTRPYLFLRESTLEDESDREDRVRAFHEALRDRRLPHFNRSLSKRV